MYLLRTDMFISLKNLYRDDMFVMPSYCSVDTPFSECHGTCADMDMITESMANNDTSFVELYWTKMFSWDSEAGVGASFSSWLDYDVKEKVILTVCDRGVGVDGDQLESASPMDPSFWPVHPTMERLWMFKKISQTLTNETWPSAEYGYSIWEDCYGHRAHDVIPFRFSLKTTGDGDDSTSTATSSSQALSAASALLSVRAAAASDAAAAAAPAYGAGLAAVQRSDASRALSRLNRGGSLDSSGDSNETHAAEGSEAASERFYTNLELYSLASPSASYMPYIYADFEWSHCQSEGYDFDDVFDTSSDDDDDALDDVSESELVSSEVGTELPSDDSEAPASSSSGK